MAYLQHTSWRDRPGAVIGVVAIHAVIGYALVTGLSFTGFVETMTNPKGIFVPEVKLPPPPAPEPTLEPDAKVTDPPIHAPIPPVDLGPGNPPVVATPDILPTPDFIPKVAPPATPGMTATPRPSFSPQSASPRNSPGGWVTEADYRSSWINREMTGSARFRLTVSPAGRVESCTITGSSGHPELDKATCDLVSKRARFDPARDETGAATPGTYASAVHWMLPD